VLQVTTHNQKPNIKTGRERQRKIREMGTGAGGLGAKGRGKTVCGLGKVSGPRPGADGGGSTVASLYRIAGNITREKEEILSEP